MLMGGRGGLPPRKEVKMTNAGSLGVIIVIAMLFVVMFLVYDTTRR